MSGMQSETAIRIRHLDAANAGLERGDSPAGAGQIWKRPIWADGGQSHGIWEMSPGVLTGVQGPESVYIISGKAQVVIQPTGETAELQAGDTFVIDRGETADWTVTETVRKFYVVNK